MGGRLFDAAEGRRLGSLARERSLAGGPCGKLPSPPLEGVRDSIPLVQHACLSPSGPSPKARAESSLQHKVTNFVRGIASSEVLSLHKDLVDRAFDLKNKSSKTKRSVTWADHVGGHLCTGKHHSVPLHASFSSSTHSVKTEGHRRTPRSSHRTLDGNSGKDAHHDLISYKETLLTGLPRQRPDEKSHPNLFRKGTPSARLP